MSISYDTVFSLKAYKPITGNKNYIKNYTVAAPLRHLLHFLWLRRKGWNEPATSLGRIRFFIIKADASESRDDFYIHIGHILCYIRCCQSQCMGCFDVFACS